MLKGRFPAEPKWVDLSAYRDGADPRDARFLELGADFAAAIHGMPKEDLLSQEVRQQRRALTLAMSAAALMLLLAVGAVTAGIIAKVQAERAERNFAAAKEHGERPDLQDRARPAQRGRHQGRKSRQDPGSGRARPSSG